MDRGAWRATAHGVTKVEDTTYDYTATDAHKKNLEMQRFKRFFLLVRSGKNIREKITFELVACEMSREGGHM